jgi:GntR family transcriptional repressor for pyruvate dehydrogenase complex
MPHLRSTATRRMRNGHIFRSLLHALQQRIYAGEWTPGEHLPSITHLAQNYEVSTGSVREALRSLQSQGMVRIEHGRGVIVISNQSNDAFSAHEIVPNLANIVALAEARCLIEPELAALAAIRGTPAELNEICQLAITMEQNVLAGLDFVDADTTFHHAIACAAHNSVLQQMIQGVRELFALSRQLTSKEQGMTSRAVRYHRLIADAIYERNAPQARLLMQAHMNDAQSGIRAIHALHATESHPMV